jgi:hypothetical protein
MDAYGAKPSQEPKGVPSMMEEMRKMCCSEEFSPADMCRRMMRFMGRTPDAEASSEPGSGMASDERGSSSQDEAHRGCCAPRPRCATERL